MSVNIADELDSALETMTAEQKIKLMEKIWGSLAKKPGEISLPAWHGEVLAERRAGLESGEEEVMDIEVAEEFLNQLSQ